MPTLTLPSDPLVPWDVTMPDSPGPGRRPDSAGASRLRALLEQTDRRLESLAQRIRELQRDEGADPAELATLRDDERLTMALQLTILSRLGQSDPQAVESVRLVPAVAPDGRATNRLYNPYNLDGPPIVMPDWQVTTDPASGRSFLINLSQSSDPVPLAGPSPDQASREAVAAADRQLGYADLRLRELTLQFNQAKHAADVENEALKRLLESRRITLEEAQQSYQLYATNLRSATDRLQSALRAAEASDLMAHQAWMRQGDWDVKTWEVVQEAISNRATRESVEDVAAFTAQAQAQQQKRTIAGSLALEHLRSYNDALQRMAWVPDGWWEAFQKGARAIAAGRSLPLDFMRGVGQPTAILPDAQEGARALAAILGTSPENPFGPDVSPSWRGRPEPAAPPGAPPPPDLLLSPSSTRALLGGLGSAPALQLPTGPQEPPEHAPITLPALLFESPGAVEPERIESAVSLLQPVYEHAVRQFGPEAIIPLSSAVGGILGGQNPYDMVAGAASRLGFRANPDYFTDFLEDEEDEEDEEAHSGSGLLGWAA